MSGERSAASGPVFSYKLRYIVGFWLVEMAISTSQKPTIYRNLYENTGPGSTFHRDDPPSYLYYNIMIQGSPIIVRGSIQHMVETVDHIY